METMLSSSSKKRKGGILQRMNAAQEDVHTIAKAGQEDINKTHDGLSGGGPRQDCKIAAIQESGKNIDFNDG